MIFKIISLICALFCVMAHAETYSIDTQANGVAKADVETITELIQINFKNEFGSIHQLVSSDKATFNLKTKILKLDNLYIINLEKEKGGVFIFSASIKSPKSDELDQKIARLIRAVVKEEPLKDKVGEITDSEKAETSIRRQSVNRWYVGFGPAVGRNLGFTKTMTDFALGYNWEVSALASIRAFWESVTEPGSDKHASFTNIGLGLQYFLNNNNNAPYILGDLGRASAKTNFNEETSGFSLGAGAGYTLFRTSSTNFDLLLRMQTLTGSNKFGTPSTFSFRIGVLF